MTFVRRGLLAILLMICAGCSSLAGGPSTFAALSDRQAVLVTWVRDGDHVSGTIQQARAAAKSSPDAVTSSNSSFTGTVSGGAVSLQVGGQLGVLFGRTVTGSLDGGDLSLNVPSADGRVSSLTLISATTDDYNDAVEQIRNKAQGERDQAASDQADRQAQETLAATQAQLDSDLTDLAPTTKALRSAVDDLDSAVADVRSSLADQQKLARQSRTVGCDDFASTQSDEGGAASDVAGAVSDYDGAVSDLEGATRDVETLRDRVSTGVGTLRDAGGEVPDTSALKDAASALKKSASTRRTDDPKVKSLEATSSKLDDEVQNLSRC